MLCFAKMKPLSEWDENKVVSLMRTLKKQLFGLSVSP